MLTKFEYHIHQKNRKELTIFNEVVLFTKQRINWSFLFYKELSFL